MLQASLDGSTIDCNNLLNEPCITTDEFASALDLNDKVWFDEGMIIVHCVIVLVIGLAGLMLRRDKLSK